MKKYMISALVLVLTACGGNKNDAGNTAAPAAENPNEAGMNLIAKSDCLTCHKLNEQLIGPSYKAIAEKYPNTEANISLLAEKIIKGGSGVWGTVPMAAHPAFSKAEATEMVKYILAVK